MSVLALLAAAVVPIAPAQAVHDVGHGHTGEVAGSSLVYLDAERGRGVVRRLGLDSGTLTTLYAAPDRRTQVGSLEAGGNTAAVETVSRDAGIRLIVIDAETGARRTIARGRHDLTGCGHRIELLDVSPAGAVLFREATVRCGRRSGVMRVRMHHPEHGLRTLVRRRVEDTFFSSGPPWYVLGSDLLVTWGDRVVRVRDLSSGELRRFTPPDLFTSFSEPQVADDGRVALGEFRFMGRNRPPRQTIRLLGPTDGGGDGRVVHRTRRAFGDLRFCGERPVLRTLTRRGVFRLRALDPPVDVFTGRIEPDGEGSCGPRHWVWQTISGNARESAFVYALPG